MRNIRVILCAIAVALAALACQTPSAAPTRPPARPADVAARFDPAAAQLQLDPVATGLQEPTHVTSAFDGTGRLFVLEKAGRIRIIRNGSVVGRPFLDIRSLVGSRGSEQGLLGLAFHPRYRETGSFYVNYTDRRGDTVIARYTVSTDPDAADDTSAALLFRIPQPAANHNGGNLVFGPDGYLYVGMGDGGGGGDTFGNGQNLTALLGKMLRVDVDARSPYGIPPDNPFVERPEVRPEIWAYGLRNPWRYSFDRATGDLYIADVGQNAYEEIHLQPAGSTGGQNYGWPIMEGMHCFPARAACDGTGLEMPVAEYSHDLGCSITGGFVYRGPRYPAAHGAYLYADFCSGRIWALGYTPDGSWRQTELLRTDLGISSFGEDEEGELYLTSLGPGGVYHLRFGP